MRVLFVDDEAVVIKALSSSVDWEKLGIGEVCLAYNISDAKKIIKEKNIEILICDIEMPNGSGIDLMEWIQENGCKLFTILVTCHAEFEYAAKAIKLGVMEYLLKPVNISSLEQSIQKAKEKIQIEQQNTISNKFLKHNKQIVVESFWREILTGMYQHSDYAYIEVTAELKGINLNHEIQYTPILIHTVPRKKILKDSSLESFAIKNIALETLQQNNNEIPPITVEENFYVILLKRSSAAYKCLQDSLRSFITAVDSHLSMKTNCLIGNAVKLPELANETRELWHQMDKMEQNKNPILKQETVIDKVKNLIEQKLDQNLTREQLAKEVYMNPDYLGKLFKKETSISLADYILVQKLEQSKRLLIDTDSSISNIAADLGFQNFSYFSKVFKKMTSLTPGEYRKKNKL